MSVEHSPARSVPGAATSGEPDDPGKPADPDYWYCLIDEKAAAEFLDLTDRTLQKYRQTGDGPRYAVISSRCLRYRRVDLREWAEARMRSSTSDPGEAAA